MMIRRNPRSDSFSRGRGFTILELIVTVSMMGILLAIAALNSTGLLSKFRLGSAARQVATDLRLVRTKAVQEGASYRAVFAPGSTYSIDRFNQTTAAWEPHALYSRATTAGAAAPISLPRPVAINSTVTVVFRARGSTDGSYAIHLTDPGMASPRIIDVTFAGHVSIR